MRFIAVFCLVLNFGGCFSRQKPRPTMAVHGGELACRRVQPFAEAEQREFYRARVTRADLGEYLALSTVPMTPANEQLMEKVGPLGCQQTCGAANHPMLHVSM
jgi:hypothetical protein